MRRRASPSAAPEEPLRRPRAGRLLLASLPVAALGFAALLGSPTHPVAPAPALEASAGPDAAAVSGEAAATPERTAALASRAWMFDPAPMPAFGPEGMWRSAPLASAFRSPDATSDQVPGAIPGADAEGETLASNGEPVRDAAFPAPEAMPEPDRLAEMPPETRPSLVPLPVPRPPEFRAMPDARLAERPSSRRTRTAALPAPAVDDRSFLEKLFGGGPTPPAGAAPALSYAALEAPSTAPTKPNGAPAGRISPAPFPSVPLDSSTAIYDISARAVVMPNGERLEAHSGLGPRMDDPRYVHVRMQGPTPPGTYDLTEREQLFHGVRAIRLTPVGGNAAVYGRDGLLAHTYMLGPTGASNGCVSFRDYDRFLQAFLRGEVRRLVVVAGRGDGAPGRGERIGQRRTGRDTDA